MRRQRSAWQRLRTGHRLVEHRRDQGLGLALDPMQVILAHEALGVDLVDLFGAGRTCGEPALVRRYLDPADGGLVPGRLRYDGIDRVARKLARAKLRRRPLLQYVLLG